MDPNVSHHPLILVSQDDIDKIRRMSTLTDKDVERLDESLQIIADWCYKQDHFVNKEVGKKLIERIFILCKGSLEDTKTKLDRFLTSKTMMPELTMNVDLSEFEAYWTSTFFVPLPKLMPSDLTRISITKLNKGNFEHFNILTHFRYCFLVGEYRLNFDYSPFERFVYDFEDIPGGLITKLNPIIMKKAEILCTDGFSTKIKGIHFVNAPPFIDKILFIVKQALKEKIAKRIFIHSSLEDLHKHIPKEILPKDYGGDEPSIQKLADLWKDELKSPEGLQLRASFKDMITDETKRNAAKFNEEYMGMPGSFRSLTVD